MEDEKVRDRLCERQVPGMDGVQSVSYQQLLQEGKQKLLQAEIADAENDSWLLLEYVTGMSRSRYFLQSSQKAAAEEAVMYQKLISQRAEHIPLQHLTGEQEFMGLAFQVNEHVLVPRQDTECLVETALEYVKDKRVLDMCTGSGCIAISLMALGQVKACDAVDFSKEALEVAQKNAVKNQVDVTFINSNLFEKVAGQYDVIVSNPPYIPPDVIEGLSKEVREHEPRMALDGGEDGLSFYRRITKESRAYLTEGGYLFYEIGCEQAEAVMEIMHSEGFGEVCCKKDYAGNDRVVWGRCERSRIGE